MALIKLFISSPSCKNSAPWHDKNWLGLNSDENKIFVISYLLSKASLIAVMLVHVYWNLNSSSLIHPREKSLLEKLEQKLIIPHDEK